MDNLKHTDIVICFSAISRLHEPPPSAVEEPKKPHTAGKRGDKPDLEKDTTNMTDLTIDGMLKKGGGRFRVREWVQITLIRCLLKV